MDQLSLADAARIVLAYISPLIAGGALTRLGEEATDASLELLGKAWDALGRRFQGDRKAEAALTLYEDDAASEAMQQKVEHYILARFQADPIEAEELLALARAIAEASPATRSVALSDSAQAGVINQGDVGRDLNLFSGELQGAYIAEVINLYQQAPAVPDADYGAALRRYLRHLYVTHATLDLRGIDQRQMDMPLTEVYVSLTVREVSPAEGALRGALRAVIERARQLVGKDEVDPGGREQTVEWTQILRYSRLAVIGLPGSGKTTLLQYTAVRLCEVLARDDDARLADLGLGAAAEGHVPPVPLLLPLRELGAFLGESRVRELAGANPRLLLDCLANYYNGFDLDLPADFFRRLCEEGRAIVLLDGLDEVPQTDDRELVSGIVRGFVNRYPHCRYVLTSRPKAYEGNARLGQGFHECTVDDLSRTKQQLFIANWSASLHRLLGLTSANATRFSAELWAALEANERVRDLATNPLLLTIIAIIYYDSRSLPENRAELYEACVTVLLKGGRGKVDRAAKEREHYSGRPSVPMSLRQKRELLAFVAYGMHERGADKRESTGREIGRADLLEIVARAPALPAGVPARESAEAFVDELPVHVGLLDEIRPEVFRFSHLSFQEFLAARYVGDAERWDELLAHYREAWWREVILLCAGHLSQERCWRFLDRLIAQGETDSERAESLALAADAIAELEKFKGQGPLNARVQTEALSILEWQPPQAVPAAARVICGRTLGVVGDPRPGVCDLPPPMVSFSAVAFVIGSSQSEIDALPKYDEDLRDKLGRIITGRRRESRFDDELNDQPVQLQAFDLARYPVTNAQYQQFIQAGAYDPGAPWWSEAGRAWVQREGEAGPDGRRSARGSIVQPELWNHRQFGIARPNHPVVGINWYEAAALCAWLTHHLNDGYVYRLPSEAEWEYAARGPARRPYPWGEDLPDGKRANFNRIHGGTSAVGCFPAGATPDGLLDMAGNVWEWTRSEYRPYPYDPNDGREDGSNPAQKRFTIRGGSWDVGSILLRAAFRLRLDPDDRHSDLGVRLARHLKV